MALWDQGAAVGGAPRGRTAAPPECGTDGLPLRSGRRPPGGPPEVTLCAAPPTAPPHEQGRGTRSHRAWSLALLNADASGCRVLHSTAAPASPRKIDDQFGRNSRGTFQTGTAMGRRRPTPRRRSFNTGPPPSRAPTASLRDELRSPLTPTLRR